MMILMLVMTVTKILMIMMNVSVDERMNILVSGLVTGMAGLMIV